MRRVLDDHQEIQVVELRRQGKSFREIASGFGVSVQAVQRAAGALASAPRKTPHTPKARPQKSTSDLPDDLDLINQLIRDTLEDLNVVTDAKVRNSLREKLDKFISHRVKLLPPPPEDPDKRPDWRKAGEDAWRRFEELVAARIKART
jgi:transposase